MVMVTEEPSAIASLKVMESTEGLLTVVPSAGEKVVAIGAVISTTKLAELEAMPILPATSVWVTTTVWLPGVSAVVIG